MLKQFLLLLLNSLISRRALALENVALRHQLEVLQRNAKRPLLRPSDRFVYQIFRPIEGHRKTPPPNSSGVPIINPWAD